MTLIRQLAWRYFRGKRSANVVPVLSRISMVAIAVGSGALIVLLSVFNGFDDLVKNLYKAFYPEIIIMPKQGKFFSFSENNLNTLKTIKGIEAVATTIEDNVLINNQQEQMVATLKGIDHNYYKVNNIKPFIYDGTDTITLQPSPTALLGLYIADQLGITTKDAGAMLTVYYPNTYASNLVLNPTDAFQSLVLVPAGVFRVQDEFDRKFILAPLSSVQSLFLQPDNFSSLEIKLVKGALPEEVKEQLSKLTFLQPFNIQTRYEQNRTMYMVMQTEKWAVYAILLLVLLIASFNMVGALTLLVLEKRKDIAILRVMGAKPVTVKSIFIVEGIIWALVGGLFGLGIGLALCYGQIRFHWIKLQGAFIIDAYPVAIRLQDVIVVILTVIIVGFLAALFPALKSTRTDDPTLKSAY
jgi:lipoprotein-releasing system permease protein